MLTNLHEYESNDNDSDEDNSPGNSPYGTENEIQLVDLDNENEDIIPTITSSSNWRPSYRHVKLPSTPPVLSQSLAIR